LLNARISDVLNKDFPSELKLCGCPEVSKRVAWMVADFRTHLRSHRGILDFNLRTSCTYFAI